jgi:tetratricopeptide (TPR) repeat protein
LLSSDMKRDFETATTVASPPEGIELSLAAVEASATFRSSPRHRSLLRFLIEHMLAGDLSALKETVIAVAVFGRPVARFDPKLDSIVRVEARRLRDRLARYYRGEGRDARLVIELPVGSYVPLVRERGPAKPRDDAMQRALGLVERGEHFLRQPLSKQTLETALARFDAALRAVPTLAAAYVGMGRAWFNLATGWHHEPKVAAEHAAEALGRGVELDPGNAVAHALLGAIQNQFERDWPTARRSFERAVALAPQLAFAHSAYGAHLYMRGAFEHADRELALAREIDPQYVNSRAHIVNLRIAQGRYDDAAHELAAMRDIAPASLATNGLTGVLALARGDAPTAVALYEELCVAAPDNAGCFACLAGAQAAAGRHDLAEATLAGMHERFADRIISPFVLAIAATHRGRHDDAFALLARADVERDPCALDIPFDPSFRALHEDPRWPALVTSVWAAPPRRRRAAEPS